MMRALLEGVIFQMENTMSIIHSIESTVANDNVNSSELLYAPSVAVQFVLPLHCILGLLTNIADPSHEEITNQKGRCKIILAWSTLTLQFVICILKLALARWTTSAFIGWFCSVVKKLLILTTFLLHPIQRKQWWYRVAGYSAVAPVFDVRLQKLTYFVSVRSSYIISTNF